MLEARTLADRCLREIRKGETLYGRYEKEGNTRCFMATWQLISFYQRLGLAIRHKQIPERSAVDLFGEVFVWWYVVFFEDQVVEVDDWFAARDLKALWQWFDARWHRMSDHGNWLRVARADKARYFGTMEGDAGSLGTAKDGEGS